jgi:DNA helicase HerA-like ATPase
LPEVGDLEKPKLVFIFDEAHLLFDGAPAALVQRIEQVVRLIRSKGVGVYFCSQFPDDVPANILGQLGNRVQHALRAFTPRDQKAVKTAAQTFVQNPKLDVVATLSQLGTGEALVSTLQDKGIPSPVQKTLVAPPRCRMGAISEAERMQVRAGSPVGSRYDVAINRESAAEILAARAQQAAEQAQAPKVPSGEQGGGIGQKLNEFLFGTGRRQGVVESVAKQTTRNVGGSIGRSVGSSIGESVMGKTGRKYGGQIGNQIVRGILGGIFGRR